MDQHEERLAVAALFAEQLAKARHIIATTEARIAASDAVIDQMAQALAGREGSVIPGAEHLGSDAPLHACVTEFEIGASLSLMLEAFAALNEINPPARDTDYTVSKGAEIVHRHTEPTAPRWPLTVATDGERNGRLAWVPGL